MARWWTLMFLAILTGGCVGAPSGAVVLPNAGDDRDVLVGETAALDGQASVGVKSARWSFTSKPAGSSASLSEATTLTPAFTPDVAGNYVAELSVNGGVATDTVILTAKNVLAAITVPEGSAVATRTRFNTTEYVINLEQAGGILSGGDSRVSGSGAAIKTQGSGIISYVWEQVSGPGARVTGGTNSSTLAFTAPSLSEFLNESDRYKWQALPVSRDDTAMVFKLSVADSSGNSDSATLTLYVQDDDLEIHRSSGLPNVGIGTTVYLSGPALKANANTDSTAVTDWSWTLSPPSGSSAAFLDTGNASSSIQFPRFIPDKAGLYTVSYSSGSAGASGEIRINVAEWVGVGTVGGTAAVSPQCANCHDGSIQPDRVTGWSSTQHAALFEDSMGTYAGLAPEPYLWEFHTVGYDSDASNGGFDDLARANDFIFPEDGLTFPRFVSDFPEVAKLANVQCENCHGPGGQHAGDPLRIAHSASQFGTCGQCHTQESEWIHSAHNSTGVVHGRGAYQATWVGNAGCVRCHSALGFKQYLEEGEEGLAAVTETGAFPGVTCAACHDPHDATNERQLRLTGDVAMIIDNATVKAGKAAVCYSCHDGNYAYGEIDCDSDGNGLADAACATTDQTATQYWRQVHYNPQGPVLEGKGALTDLDGDGTAEFTLTENSFHSDSRFVLSEVTGDASLPSSNDKCVTCHMAPGPSAEEVGHLHLGGHAFKLRVEHGIGHLRGEEDVELGGEEASIAQLELVSACTSCHPSVTAMNRLARDDYDGDGNQEGIQDEVEGLLLALSSKIRSLDGANVRPTSGTIQSGSEITVNALTYTGSKSTLPPGKNCTTSLPADGKDAYQPCNFTDASPAIRRAIWNHNLIARDGSLGIHNAAFAIQTLQKTYTAVGGNSFANDFPNATLR